MIWPPVFDELRCRCLHDEEDHGEHGCSRAGCDCPAGWVD